MFRDVAVRRVALARWISGSGGFAAFFVGIWGRAAYDFQADPAQLAVLMGAIGVTGIAGSVAAGVLIDRYGPRRVLIWSEALFAPLALAPAFASSMSQLALGVAAGSLLYHVVLTAIGSLPPFLVSDPDRLAQANAAVEFGETLALVSGPAVGAVIVGVAGLDWIFAFDALTSLVAVALVAGVRVTMIPGDSGAPPKASALAELRDGVRFALRAPLVRFCLLAAALVWVSFGAFNSLEPLFYREVLNTGPEAIGWVNMLFGAGLGAGSLLYSRMPHLFMSIRALTLLVLASGLGAVIYTGTADLRVVVVGALAWGSVLGVLFPSLRTVLQLHTPDFLIGRVMGVLQVHHNVGSLLPLAVVPSLATVWGVQAVLVGTGAVLALVCAALLPVASSLDRSPAAASALRRDGRRPARSPTG